MTTADNNRQDDVYKIVKNELIIVDHITLTTYLQHFIRVNNFKTPYYSMFINAALGEVL